MKELVLQLSLRCLSPDCFFFFIPCQAPSFAHFASSILGDPNLRDGTSNSTGSTISIPEYRVAPMEVRYPHRASGNFSGQSRHVFVIFRGIWPMFLFAVSTAPLIWGLYDEDFIYCIWYRMHSCSTSFLKWDPRSEIGSCDTPYPQTMFSLMNLATFVDVSVQ